MITYNQYPQLGVRQRPLAVTCLSWRDFLRKQDLLRPASTESSWCHYRHLGPPLISWLCPRPPQPLTLFASAPSLLHPHVAGVGNFISLKAVSPLSGHLDQFSQFIKRDQVQQIGWCKLADGFVGSPKISLFNLLILLYFLWILK